MRKLANEIIATHRKEMKAIEWLIEDIRANGAAETQEEASARPVPDFAGIPE